MSEKKFRQGFTEVSRHLRLLIAEETLAELDLEACLRWLAQEKHMVEYTKARKAALAAGRAPQMSFHVKANLAKLSRCKTLLARINGTISKFTMISDAIQDFQDAHALAKCTKDIMSSINTDSVSKLADTCEELMQELVESTDAIQAMSEKISKPIVDVSGAAVDDETLWREFEAAQGDAYPASAISQRQQLQPQQAEPAFFDA